MILLLVSIAALFAGVLAFPLAAKKNSILSVLDGFVVFSVGGLVVFHLFPHSFNEAGFGAIGAAAVGLTFPLLIERWSEKRNDGEGNLVLVVLVLLGLATHAFMDGNALVFASMEEHGDVHDHGSKYEHGFTLALASLFHRLPIGLAIGNLLARDGSLRRPLAVAAMMAVTTCAGFFVGEKAIPLASNYAVSIFQAFVAGTLLHVVLEHVPVVSGRITRRTRVLRGLGALAGAGAVAVVALFHPVTRHCAAELTAGETFLRMLFAFSPALFAALFSAGLIRYYIFPAMTWVQRRGPIGQILRFDTLLISLPILGPVVTGARFIASAIAALAASYILERRPIPLFKRSRSPESGRLHHKAHSPKHGTMGTAFGYGFGEFTDHLLPWMLVGLAGAALAEPLIHTDYLAVLPGWLQVPIVALCGMPIYLCGSGMIPLIAVLIHKGMTVGAAIAFLIVGPMISVTSFHVLSVRYGRPRTVCFAAALWVLACGIGWSADSLGLNAGLVPQLSSFNYGDLTKWIFVIALGLLALISFLRCGPRGWLGQLNAAYDDHGQCDLPGHLHHEETH